MIAYDIFSYSDTGWFMSALSFFNSTNNKILVTIALVFFLIIVIEIVALWGIFTKAKKPGFISLIPIVNAIYLLKIAKMKAYHLVLICIPIVGIYFWYRLSMNLAQVFKKRPIFGWGLFFLSPIFLIILGFGDTEYDKDYYYTEVEETSPTKEVIAPNRMVFEDYNQGLIFDPSQNVDDVVTAAPITNDTNKIFESNTNEEGINMTFQDMSDAAANNINGAGNIPEIGASQLNSEMELVKPSAEPPKSYSAMPNEFFIPENNQNANAISAIPPQESTINNGTKFGATPPKMTVEQLLGIQSTEAPSTPTQPPVVQSNINADNVFGMQLQEETPTLDSTSAPSLNSSSQQIPSVSSPFATVSQPTENNNKSFENTTNSPIDTVNMRQESADSSNSMGLPPSEISQDINQILGINPDSIQSVPIKEDATQTEKNTSETDFFTNGTDSISEILGINPNELEAVPIIKNDLPIVPEINPYENTTSSNLTGDSLQNEVVSGTTQPEQSTSPSTTSDLPKSNSEKTSVNEIDIDNLLGLPQSNTNVNSVNEEKIQPISNNQDVKKVINIEDSTPAMINNAVAATDTIPANNLTTTDFNLDKFLSNNQIDAEPNQSEMAPQIGQIQSFVGQLKTTSEERNEEVQNNFLAKEEKKVEKDKICSNCGAKLPQEAKFCYLCGKPV